MAIDPLQLFQQSAAPGRQFQAQAANILAQRTAQERGAEQQTALLQEQTRLQQASPLFQAQVKNLQSSIASREANVKFAQEKLGLSKQNAIDDERRHRETLQNNIQLQQIISQRGLRDDDRQVLKTSKSNFDNSIRQLTSELSGSFLHGNINPVLINTIANKLWNGIPKTELTPEEQQMLGLRDIADRIDGMIQSRVQNNRQLSFSPQRQPTGLPRPPSFIQPQQPTTDNTTDSEIDEQFKEAKVPQFQPLPVEAASAIGAQRIGAPTVTDVLKLDPKEIEKIIRKIAK